MVMGVKQREIKIEPRVKLNHNVIYGNQALLALGSQQLDKRVIHENFITNGTNKNTTILCTALRYVFDLRFISILLKKKNEVFSYILTDRKQHPEKK